MIDERELVKALGQRFIQRKDAKACQRDNGDWYPVRGDNGSNLAFTMQDFRDHLAGTKTLGHYMVDQEGYCKLFAFDIDLVKHDRSCQDRPCKGCAVQMLGDDDILYSGIPRESWAPGSSHPLSTMLTRHLRCMAEGLAINVNRVLELPVAIAFSGHKGLHVYAFTGTVKADAIRQLALRTLEGFGCFESFKGDHFWRHVSEYHTLEIEVFPKQDNMEGKEYGNLMKLPLGVHRVTGQRAEFLTTKADYQSLVSMDPMRVLSGDLPWE